MGRYVINRDGGSFTSDGMLRFLDTLFRYGVATGWAVTQRASGSNMSVDVAAGAGDFKVSSSYPVFAYSDGTESATVTAASPSNARRDLVVAYIDLSVVNDTNNSGALKFAAVPGIAATSPVDPTVQAIQTAVGAGTPYQVIARVKLPAGTTNVTTSMIDDLRTPMALANLAVFDGANIRSIVSSRNGSVNSSELRPGLVNWKPTADQNLSVAAGSTVTGATTTYTTGPTAERLLLQFSGMLISQGAGANFAVWLSINGVEYNEPLLYVDTYAWQRQSLNILTDPLPAGTTVTIAIRAKQAVAGTGTLHMAAPYGPRLTGVAVAA